MDQYSDNRPGGLIDKSSVYYHDPVDHSIVSESAELMQVLVALITCCKRLLLNLGGTFGPQELSRTAKYGHSARPLKAGAPENTMEIMLNKSGIRSAIIQHPLPKSPPRNVLDFGSKTEGIDLDFLKAKSGEEARARDRIHQLLSLLSNELTGEMSRQLKLFNAESASRAGQARKKAIAAQALKTGTGKHLRAGAYEVGEDADLPRVKAEAAQERAEASDAIMRLLQEYHLLSTVDTMSYLRGTIETTLPRLARLSKKGKKGGAPVDSKAAAEEDSIARMLEQHVKEEGTSPIAAAAAMITAGTSRVDGGRYGLYETVSEQGSFNHHQSVGSVQSAPSFGSNNFSSYYGLKSGPGYEAAEAEHRAIMDPEAIYREAAMRDQSFPIDRAMAVVHKEKVNNMTMGRSTQAGVAIPPTPGTGSGSRSRSPTGQSYGGGYHTGLSGTAGSGYGRGGYGASAAHTPKGLSLTHPESAASMAGRPPTGQTTPGRAGGGASSAGYYPSPLAGAGASATGSARGTPGPMGRMSPADPLKYTRGTPLPLQPMRSTTPQVYGSPHAGAGAGGTGDWNDIDEQTAKAFAAQHHEQQLRGGRAGMPQGMTSSLRR
jgi:hypothetical protein